jgi:acetolactate decarboxylase
MKGIGRPGKRIAVVCLVALLLAAVCRPDCTQAVKAEKVLFQLSTIGSLFRGVYDGALTCGELKQRGDFGIGTFDGLDGEMVVLDGKVFQVRGDGRVLAADDKLSTPFAVVTFFDADQKLALNGVDSLGELQQKLEPLFPSRNIFYAIRIDGLFSYVKTRSVPKQEKPYRPIVQSEFEARGVKGTLVGFWCPGYVQGINAAGFHFHFVSDDRKMGGHLLECVLAEGDAQIQHLSKFELMLLATDAFRKADLSRR